jgi:mandelate racemase/muconate lactonizing enzyme-like protein
MTKIASAETYMISVPRPQPVWTAHEESKAWNVILTEVRTDDGLVGYGEIHGAPMPRICQWVSRFGEIVRGMDALENVAVWEKLFALTSPRPGGIEGLDGLPPPVPRGERTQVMAAIAGIDIALWDIKGKAVGLPAARTARSSPMRPAVIIGRMQPMLIMAESWRDFSSSATAPSSSRRAPAPSLQKRTGSQPCDEPSAMSPC